MFAAFGKVKKKYRSIAAARFARKNMNVLLIRGS